MTATRSPHRARATEHARREARVPRCCPGCSPVQGEEQPDRPALQQPGGKRHPCVPSPRGATWAAKKRATRAKIERSYEDDARRRAREVEPDDAQTVPVTALDAELRRTVGWIRYLESRVRELSDDQLIWGLTDQELRSAGLRGRDVDAMAAQQRGRAHPVIELLERERGHLIRLLGILLSHGVQERSLQLRADQVDSLQAAIDAVVRGLGHNPADRDVRATVLAALRTL